jgi:hypothetical protein
LTSAGTVHDAPGLKDWSGEALEREKLVGTWRELMKDIPGDELKDKDKEKDDNANGSGNEKSTRWVGQGRLEELIRQAGAWQVQQARQRGSAPWTLRRWVQISTDGVWYSSS